MDGLLGASVAICDPDEEAFLVFSQSIPSRPLGAVDSKASTLHIQLSPGGRELSIHQSPTLLTSDRRGGTTGAVVWSVTPLFAAWLSSSQNPLFQSGLLTADSAVLELGCGVAGIVALALAPSVRRYIATDQDYVLKLLRRNLVENTSSSSITGGSSITGSSSNRGKVSASKTAKKPPKKNTPVAGSRAHGGSDPDEATLPPNIQVMPLDWELTSIASVSQLLGLGHTRESESDQAQGASLPGVDLLIACDCIYNEALVEPFVSTCAEICRLRNSTLSAAGAQQPATICLIAQQLRSPDVFEAWLTAFHAEFETWRLGDDLLSEELRENSGFVIHIGLVRN